MPDYREKTFWFNKGHSCGYTYNGYAPNITGSFFIGNTQWQPGEEQQGPVTGAFYRDPAGTYGVNGANWTRSGSQHYFDASRSSHIYGNPHDSLLPDDAIVPRSLSCRGLIKYI